MVQIDIIASGILPLALFIFGAIIGSFINADALNFDTPRKKRSQCPNCKTKLGFYDLFPVLSYLVLGGKCRYCQAKISFRYFLVEILSGLFFLFAYLNFGLSLELVLALIVFSFGMLASLIDLRSQILPDKILVPLGVVLITLNLLNNIFGFFIAQSDWNSWWVGFLLGGGVIGLIFMLTLGRGIGFGDVKFSAILGITLGGPKTLLMIFCAFVVGATFGIILLFLKKASSKTAIAFGPFIFLGWIIAILWGSQILAWYNGLSI